MTKIILFFLTFILLQSCTNETKQKTKKTSNIATKTTWLSPDEAYQALFVAVQMQKVFPDGKTFADCTPKFSREEILTNYNKQKELPTFDLKKFVATHFDLPKQYASNFKSDTTQSPETHINLLWSVLTRQPEQATKGTLITLPKPYIVPGGRFGEIYYWDSYFTMLGLQVSNQVQMMENMLDNFAYLIDEFGYIPNGNRTYFLGRSQPPFFAAMVNLLAEMKGNEVYLKYHIALEKEYLFWMDGADKLTNENPAYRRVVRLKDGSILNRYWDDKNTPRPESYREDVETAQKSKQKPEEIYRNLRAGAESGWDYSSRWFEDGQNLHTIVTTKIIPVDLNSLLYNLEMTLARICELKKKHTKAEEYRKNAKKRKEAVAKYCWNEEENIFSDYQFKKQTFTKIISLAGIYPLCFEMATSTQADSIAKTIQEKFLKDGGLIPTINHTNQQWDAPNGWAPLQWMSIWGLRNYQKNDLAQSIKIKWINLNTKVFKKTGKMVEKYNVEDLGLDAGGGEYALQDGFGWTNGVLLRLLMEK